MKKLLQIITLLLVGGVNYAQTQFSLPLQSTIKHALILIERNSVNIQGFAGNEMQIAIEKPISFPDVADGLKRIYKQGLNDNTELGLNISQEDTLLIIREVCNCYSGTYRIKIPQNLEITMFEYANNWGKNWRISDITGSLDLKTEFGNIVLKNVSGNIKASTRHGKVEADLVQVKNISLTCNFGKLFLDISENIQANLKILNCLDSEIFTDFDLPELAQNQKEINTKINEGGKSNIELRSDHSEIYLRKRKKTQ